MRNLKLTLFVVVLIVGWLGAFTSAPAQIITSVSRGGSSRNPLPVIAPNSLAEDELCFVDRTHQYNSIPIRLLGAEYVMVSNEDKTQSDFSLNVTLSQSARLYLFLDNRLGHGTTAGGDPNLNPDLWSAGMDWVYSMGFADTGLNIGIDEGGDGQINQWESVYVKNFPAGTVTLLQQNDTTNPSERNMYGAAALKFRLFPAFWFDNGKLNLAQTPDWVTVRSGYYGGWDWFDDGGYWRQPFENRPLGGANLWAFTTHLTLQYTDAGVHPLHRWFFLWDPSGQGNCLEITTEDVGLSSPLDPNIMDNLVIQNHAYSVNADKVQGVFSDLELVPINTLEGYVRDLGMTAEDVRTFLDGEIFSHLKITDPCDQGDVGVQYAQWSMPELQILFPGSIVITEGQTISYPVRLREQPDGPVTVNVKYNDPATIKWADFDEDVYQLQFDETNWNQNQIVSIAGKYFGDGWRSSSNQTAGDYVSWIWREGSIGGDYVSWIWKEGSIAGNYFFDIWTEGKPGRIAHYMAGDPTETAVLPVRVMDKKTAGRGYAGTDLNRDGITNLLDVAFVANAFLESTEQPQGIDIWDPDVMVSQDIGTTGGSAEYDPAEEVWTVQADGADIFGTSDQFHYVYKQSECICQLTATVLSLESTHVWAKAGLMFRKTLDPDSAHASIFVTPERGVAFQYRETAGDVTYSIDSGPVAHLKAPVSLRLVKTCDTVTGYYYVGGTWKELGSLPLIAYCMTCDSFIGMAVTSHVDGVLTTATFSSDLVDINPVPLP